MKGCRIKEIFENWSEIRIAWKTKNWKLEFRKLPLRIGILEIKFERNWNLENYLRIRVLKIKFERNWNFENDLRIGVLKIKLWIRVLDIIWRGNFKNKQINKIIITTIIIN